MRLCKLVCGQRSYTASSQMGHVLSCQVRPSACIFSAINDLHTGLVTVLLSLPCILSVTSLDTFMFALYLALSLLQSATAVLKGALNCRHCLVYEDR